MKTMTERFWSFVDKKSDADCWPWTGCGNKNGYGRFWNDGRLILATHASILIATGAMPPTGKLVCHSCDNPPCVNPAHLWIGTVRDNAKDSATKGRQHMQKRTHCPQGHALTPANLCLSKLRHGHRECRICGNACGRAYRAASKAKKIHAATAQAKQAEGET